MTEPRWLDDGEATMWRAFIRMNRALQIAGDRQLAEQGLSAADFEILAALSEAEHRTLRVRDLGTWIGWDRSRIAHQLKRMEQRGLIARSECPADGRGTMVQLTDQGQAAVAAAAPGHVEVIRRLFIDQLDADDIKRLAAIADRVITASDAPPIPGCPS
ncbi:MarR family winged helix-turn-helix transcriptional regulator [Micromonosporaceae bacterium Da 78-11]